MRFIISKTVFLLTVLILAALGLNACTSAQETTAVSDGLTIAVDAVACQADVKGIKGLTVANAVRVATTPSCVAALNQAIAAGQSAATVK